MIATDRITKPIVNATHAKPFVKWVGGKGQLLDTLDRLLPDNFRRLKEVTYIEPFVGGGAMLFHMLSHYPNITRAIINDVNESLTKAYITVRDKPYELIDSLEAIRADYLSIRSENERKEFYIAIRSRYNNSVMTDVEKTTALIFLNKTCFNGLYRVNSKGFFNVPFGRYAAPTFFERETILADSALLQHVEVLTGDFEETEKLIKDGNILVYFDPPYRPLDATSSFTSYTLNGFNDNDQRRLKKYVDRLSARGCKVMLSNSDCRGRNTEDTFFDDIYCDYHIERVWASRSINANPDKRGRLTELLIRNFSNKNLFDYNESTLKRTV